MVGRGGVKIIFKSNTRTYYTSGHLTSNSQKKATRTDISVQSASLNIETLRRLNHFGINTIIYIDCTASEYYLHGK